MQVIRLLVSLLLFPYFLCPPQSFAQVEAAPVKKEMLYQKILKSAERKTEILTRKLPVGNVMVVQAEKSKAVKEEILKRAEALKTANNAEIAVFKKELLRMNEQEMGNMRNELQGFLNAMSDKEITELGSFLKTDKMYSDSALEFTSAYTSIEKKNAIQNALMNDLSFLRSVYNKKIGLATKAELMTDLHKNLSIFEAQSADKADTKKILQISLMVLAGVALATWGISSAVYGSRLSKVRSEREAQLNLLQQNLEAQYQTYKAELTQKELDYLNSNGYLRTVCGTYSQPDSILCNRYNYQLFSGQKRCVIYCMKNLDTGKETLHEPAICTSAFIPADCYDPQEYWDAYARGEDDGYDDGYWDGDWDGDVDGRSAGRYDGEDDGYDDGWADGYDDGYDDGYASGAADSGDKKKSRFRIPFKQSEAYAKGFRDGLEQYQILFLNY